MKTNKEQLLKHFATVLRNLATGKQTDNLMSQNLAFYFTRKELIEMVKKYFGGSIPKQHNLVELENKELLDLIDNQLFIISYITEKWSQEPVSKKEPVNPKPKPHEKKDEKTKQSPKG